MWKFLQDKDFKSSIKTDYIFKRKVPCKTYIQVKVNKINDEQQVIVFINDITRIKELESISYRVRSMFFSSVTHELRTPLNSIIPMTKLLLDIIKDPRAQQYLGIIYNTSLHLQNVVEDALDLCSIENGKFEVQYSEFDIRKAVEEVCHIMHF